MAKVAITIALVLDEKELIERHDNGDGSGSETNSLVDMILQKVRTQVDEVLHFDDPSYTRRKKLTIPKATVILPIDKAKSGGIYLDLEGRKFGMITITPIAEKKGK